MSGGRLALALLLVAATSARADVVGPPPESCPVGSVPASSHIGGFCRAPRCEGSGSCELEVGLIEPKKLSGTCQERKLCLAKVTQKGGWASGRVTETVEDACESAPCRSGTCTTLRVCVAEGAHLGPPNPLQRAIREAREKKAREAREKQEREAKERQPAATAPAKGCGCSLGALPGAAPCALVVAGLLGLWIARRRGR